jgi:hypothetical protein
MPEMEKQAFELDITPDSDDGFSGMFFYDVPPPMQPTDPSDSE